jgi:hypothetical protein
MDISMGIAMNMDNEMDMGMDNEMVMGMNIPCFGNVN